MLNSLTCFNVSNIVSINKYLYPSLLHVSWSPPDIAARIIWTMQPKGVSTIETDCRKPDFNTTHEATREIVK